MYYLFTKEYLDGPLQLNQMEYQALARDDEPTAVLVRWMTQRDAFIRPTVAEALTHPALKCFVTRIPKKVLLPNDSFDDEIHVVFKKDTYH